VGRRRDRKQEEQLKQRLANGGGPWRIAVDLTLSDYMNRKEIARVADHVSRVYSFNMSLPEPWLLYLNGLEQGSVTWREFERRTSGFGKWLLKWTPVPHHEYFKSEKLVYLTPDADEPLVDLEADTVC
jgi:hypothetical protein